MRLLKDKITSLRHVTVQIENLKHFIENKLLKLQRE